MTRPIVDGKLQCSQCHGWKETSEYHRTARRNPPYQSYCKECSKGYYKGWQEQKPETRRRHQEWKSLRVAESREYIIDYLREHPCIDCGNADIRVLVFDHITDTKVAGVMALVNRGATREKIDEEIEKCEVRCANCHLIVTQTRGGFWLASLIR